MESVIALVDCDSFYASCEQVFRPDLANKAVVVLSNNDGFIIAANKQAKALGYKAIEKPFFQEEARLKKDGVTIFSANFELYGDLSSRIHGILHTFSPDIEVYSIDEAFIDLAGLGDPTEQGQKIKKAIWRQTGVPVSIGIGSTKTLAKLATRHAKKHPECNGVFDITKQKDMDGMFEKLDVNDIWGIGGRYTEFLKRHGINTVKDLKYAPLDWAQKHMTVMGRRTVQELNGTPCFKIGETPEKQKVICRSRSFGRLVNSLTDLQEAVSAYTERACEKLREQGSLSQGIEVFIMTNPHKDEPQYSRASYMRLPIPTADSSVFVKCAGALVKHIFRDGYRYLKAGVILTDFCDIDNTPGNLFLTPYKFSKSQDLMVAIDRINRKFGPMTVKLAKSGVEGKPWTMRQAHRSKRYTTRIEEIPEARA